MMFKEVIMEKNVGQKDKNIRLLVGAALIILSFVWKCWICIILALILIITAVLQKCPAYKMMGKSTCEKK